MTFFGGDALNGHFSELFYIFHTLLFQCVEMKCCFRLCSSAERIQFHTGKHRKTNTKFYTKERVFVPPFF